MIFRERKTVHISKAISIFLRSEGLETPLNEHRLIEEWDKVAGKIAKYTQQIYIRNQTLHVHLSSSVAKQEVITKRKEFIRKLNMVVKANIISNIAVH